MITQYAHIVYTHSASSAILASLGRDQPIMLLFLPIMLYCSALKTYVLCSRIRIAVRLLLCYLYTSLHEQFTTCMTVL